MANELSISYTGSNQLYAIIRKVEDGKVWNGTSFENWNNSNINLYNIPLTNQNGDLWAADIPSDLPVNTKYRIIFYIQSGLSPATTDISKESYEKYWNGFDLADTENIDRINLVRRFSGNPLGDVAENPEVYDAEIRTFIQWAIREILPQLPGIKRKLGYIETIANTQSYELPNNVSKICEVHWNGSATDSPFNTDIPYACLSNFYSAIPGISEFGGGRSLGILNEIWTKDILINSSIAPTWDLIEGKIYLDPIPASDGIKVYYEYIEDTADETELDSTYEKVIILKASIYVLEQMVAVRNNKTNVGLDGFQNLMRLNELNLLIDRREKEFKEEMSRFSSRNLR